MHYLIDGHNLISKMDAISLEDPNDEVKMVLLLRKWAAGKRNRKVTVVFDGGVPGGEDQYLSTSKVKVLFAPGNLSADDLIITRINRVDNPTEYMVVTSDREVQSAARKRKLALITSEDFSPMVDATDSGDDNVEISPDPEISADELTEWLELFNGSQPKADSQS